MNGDWPISSKLPCVGGHEGTGYVVAIGDNTETDLQIGSRVGVKWLASSCGACELCHKGVESSCEKARCSGFGIDGTFQQYCVSYAAHVTPIPDSLSLKMAAPVMCAGITVVSVHLLACAQGNNYISSILVEGSQVSRTQPRRDRRRLRCRWWLRSPCHPVRQRRGFTCHSSGHWCG